MTFNCDRCARGQNARPLASSDGLLVPAEGEEAKTLQTTLFKQRTDSAFANRKHSELSSLQRKASGTAMRESATWKLTGGVCSST